VAALESLSDGDATGALAEGWIVELATCLMLVSFTQCR